MYIIAVLVSIINAKTVPEPPGHCMLLENFIVKNKRKAFRRQSPLLQRAGMNAHQTRAAMKESPMLYSC